MAIEKQGETVVRVYTSSMPQGAPDAQQRGEQTSAPRGRVRLTGALKGARRAAQRARSAHVPGRMRRRAQTEGEQEVRMLPDMRRLKRDALIACALLLGVASVRALPFDWARQTTAVMASAVNMSVDLDKTLGQLQFVREVMPESAMVFLSGGREYSAPFEGSITHSYDARQPWLEYSGDSQPVRSVRAGEVLQLEQGAAGDWAVRIGHGDGMETVYAFLSSVSVKVGDRVQSAQQIGRAEGENGARIYFEMRINGESVDPSSYLGIK